MNRRIRYTVVRFHRVSEDKGEDYYRNLLMLYCPFRDEFTDLCDSNGSFLGKYLMVQDNVKQIECLFSKNAVQYENAFQNCENDRVDDWNILGPNTGLCKLNKNKRVK